MANRRMFSKTVIKTDAFLDMPQTAQNLYFHLGIEADDDGFVSPKMVMRTLGSNDDDLKVLISKGFVIPFKSGVIVIRHWKQNNYIQSDRYQPTIYQDEFKLACEDNVYNLDTQYSIGKNRLDKIKKKKAYFNNTPLIRKFDKWYAIERGGEILFTGKEGEIEYR